MMTSIAPQAELILQAASGFPHSRDSAGVVEWDCVEPGEPQLLREFYDLAANRIELLTAHHQFVEPNQLDLNQPVLLFCSENERVVYWGVDARFPNDADPPVVQWNTQGEFWSEDCPRLSTFLLNMACWQLLCSAPRMARVVMDSRMTTWAEQHLTPASNDGDNYDLKGFFARGLMACFLSPRWLYLGAENDERLQEVEHQLGMRVTRLPPPGS